ncbi:oligosaccharide flippase family protein [Permianibacter sp. IMCC34836]|uniref:lipopolysaccharide biosynthesis protein n=1 Tax=Permianibacter fluminis TaxID=2738515 RepID=UPI00155257DD|nr:oligosaccharide flippase family protein [Permianibacter fluminis]NQD37408.1 oligosaccharide flippase family protein [Permianibacter fluminis]
MRNFVRNKYVLIWLANMLFAAIPFLLVPFLSHHMSKEDFGTLSLIESSIQVLIPLMVFGSDGYLSTSFLNLEEEGRKRLVTACLFLTILSSMLVIVALTILKFLFLSEATLSSQNFYIFIGICFLQSVSAVAGARLIISGESHQYLLFRVAPALLGAILSCTIIVLWTPMLIARLLGLLAAGVLAVLLVIRVFSFERIKLQDLKPALKSAVTFGAGVVVHSWAGIVFFSIDRLLLGTFASRSDLAMYTVALQLGLIMSVLQSSFSQIWSPYVFRTLSERSLSASLMRMEFYAVGGILLAGFIVALAVKPYFWLFVPKDYQSAAGLSYLIIGGYTALGIYKVFVPYIYFEKRTKLLATITVSLCAINGVVSFSCIKLFGVTGAGVGTLISGVVFAGVVYLSARNMPCRKRAFIC